MMARTPKTSSEDEGDAALSVLAQISLAAPSLRKGDVNQHVGFSYVSIDDYYDHIAKLAAQSGVTWSASCSDVKELPGGLYVWRIEFQVEGAGKELTVTIPVIHHYDGPQTTGMVFSYADKIFMRTMFKVVTGEKDADASAKVVPVSSAPSGAGLAEVTPADLERELSLVKNQEQLLAFTTRYNGDVVRLKKKDPVAYSILLEQYDATKRLFSE